MVFIIMGMTVTQNRRDTQIEKILKIFSSKQNPIGPMNRLSRKKNRKMDSLTIIVIHCAVNSKCSAGYKCCLNGAL